MINNRTRLELNKFELSILINALEFFKNQLLYENIDTQPLETVMSKVTEFSSNAKRLNKVL